MTEPALLPDEYPTDSAAEPLRSTFALVLAGSLSSAGVHGQVDACAIANSVTALMAPRKYHSPVHPLAMLQFAMENGMEVSHTERLAILMHDAVFRVGYEFNELATVEYWQALTRPYLDAEDGIHPETVSEVSLHILATAEHSNPTPDPQMVETSGKIMDLDLCSLAYPWEKFRRVNDLVAAEFGGTLEQVSKFLSNLASRPKIYRTAEFERFEESARLNITRLAALVKEPVLRTA
jgi:predicted metal-dependent HD superfamily phosphohydrolase